MLGRDSLTVRFYRALERAVSALASSSPVGTPSQRREVALLDASRLLFLAVPRGEGLAGRRSRRSSRVTSIDAWRRGGRFRDRVLRPLFFGTLNTPFSRRARTARAFGRVPFLNGGLFARTRVERALRGLAFSDDAYGALLFDVFGQYRFTAREETSHLDGGGRRSRDARPSVRVADGVARSAGAPARSSRRFSLVERVATSALAAALQTTARARSPESRCRRPARDTPRVGRASHGARPGVRIGRVSRARARARRRRCGRRSATAATCSDDPPRRAHALDLRRRRQPDGGLAVRAATLAVGGDRERRVADPLAVHPLPNLDRNIRVGDALVRPRVRRRRGRRVATASRLRGLRERYARATGRRKATLPAPARARRARVRRRGASATSCASVARRRRDVLVRAARARPVRRPISAVARRATRRRRAALGRAASLRALRRRIVDGGALPFSFATHFADVATRGGFGLIVGNPPWVRLHRIPRIAARRLSARVRRGAGRGVGARRARRRRRTRIRGAGRRRGAVRRAFAASCSRPAGRSRLLASGQAVALARRRWRAATALDAVGARARRGSRAMRPARSTPRSIRR